MYVFNGVKISFSWNLREPKAAKETPLYFIVKVDARQYKFVTGVKVFPHEWDNRKMLVRISPTMSDSRQQMAATANSKIMAIQQTANEILLYLCGGNVGDVGKYVLSTIRRATDTNNNDNVNRGQTTMARTATASKLIQKAFELYYVEGKVKPSARKTNMVMLDDFLRYLNDHTDSLKALTQRGLNQYCEFLISRDLSAGTINARCGLIQRLINHVLCVNSQFERYGLQKVEYVKVTDARAKDEGKKRALTDSEVNKILAANGLTERENFFLGIFRLQLATGVRFSDVSALLTCKYEVSEYNGVTAWIVKTQKEGISAIILPTDEVRDICQKYAISARKLEPNSYNLGLKSILKKAGLTDLETWYESKGAGKIQKQAPLCEVFSNHWLRHTFITNMLRGGWPPNELCDLTGHADDTMINEIYGHLSDIDKAQRAVKNLQRHRGQSSHRDSHTTESQTATTTATATATTDSDTAIIAQQAREIYALKSRISIAEEQLNDMRNTKQQLMAALQRAQSFSRAMYMMHLNGQINKGYLKMLPYYPPKN